MKTLTMVSIIGMSLLLSACGSKPAQTKKYFRLNDNTFNPTSTTLITTLKPITLVVKRPTALSILGGRPMVATQDDDSLVQLSHNFWIESPKVLLQDKIKHWAKNHWQFVTFQTPEATAQQILDTRILAFEKKQNQATVEIEFSLYEANNLIFQQRIKAVQEIQADTYKSFVNAISAATEHVFEQLDDQLKTHLRTKP